MIFKTQSLPVALDVDNMQEMALSPKAEPTACLVAGYFSSVRWEFCNNWDEVRGFSYLFFCSSRKEFYFNLKRAQFSKDL